MGGMSIGNLPNQSILKKINDIAADVNDLDLEGVNNLKSKLSELVAPELGSSDTKAISQKVVTENIERLNTEVNNKINKVESAQNGNLPSFDNGHIKDSKIPASNIAQANGYYESMIVGASRNLAGNNVVTAKYTYRPTADTTDVADGVAKISSIKGNTIVWNQLADVSKMTPFNNTNITVNIDNKKITVTNNVYAGNGTDDIAVKNSAVTANLGDKILACCEFETTNENLIPCVEYCVGNILLIKKYGNVTYNLYTVDKQSPLVLFKTFGTKEIGDVWSFNKPQVYNLTQMFGEGNEPTLEEFEAMFPNDYYEYNEGELKSIEDFQIKSVGFNAWDEETEGGVLTADGYALNSDCLRTMNFIKVLPNTTYYKNFENANRTNFYDLDKNIVDSQWLRKGIFTTPNNCFYLKSDWVKSTYPDLKLTINLSHSGIRDGEYEPYQEDILPINISTIKDENGEQLFPNGLCSAGEAHDELVYDKAIGKWKAVKRIGSVDLGNLNWYTSWYADEGRIYVNLISKAVGAMNIIYPLGITVANDNKLINSVGICGNASNTYIFIGQGATHTDSAAFIASLNGIYAYYELAEPIEVVLDDFTSNYKVSDWGTEEILMNTTPIVPVIYDVEYALNAVDTLRNMPTNYISKESLDAFLSTLGSAMGGTWTTTWNEDMQKYTFNFTPNAVNVE